MPNTKCAQQILCALATQYLVYTPYYHGEHVRRTCSARDLLDLCGEVLPDMSLDMSERRVVVRHIPQWGMCCRISYVS